MSAMFAPRFPDIGATIPGLKWESFGVGGLETDGTTSRSHARDRRSPRFDRHWADLHLRGPCGRILNAIDVRWRIVPSPLTEATPPVASLARNPDSSTALARTAP